MTLRDDIVAALAAESELMPGDRKALGSALANMDSRAILVLRDDSEFVAALAASTAKETSVPDAIQNGLKLVDRAITILTEKGILTLAPL